MCVKITKNSLKGSDMGAVTNEKKAQEIFKQYGMGLSDAFNIFLSQSVMERGIPFDVKIPSDELKRRTKNIENDTNTQDYKDTKELFADLGI